MISKSQKYNQIMNGIGYLTLAVLNLTVMIILLVNDITDAFLLSIPFTIFGILGVFFLAKDDEAKK